MQPKFLWISVMLAASSANVYAAGFGLIDNSVANMGNAYAGAAASAEDASTVWFNPAGMAELDDGTHVSAGVHIVKPTAEFTNNGSIKSDSTPLTGNGISEKTAYIPNAYAVKPINDKVKVGLGVNAPYGLETNYDANWAGRYNAIKSAMKSVNVNPSLSYKVNDKVALGAGLNAQYIDAELTSAVDLSAVGGADGKATIKGDDWSYGYNVGALLKPSAKTKVGVSYRSKMDHTLKGSATYDYTLPVGLPPPVVTLLNARLADKNAQAAANLPASLSVSVAHKVNDKVEVLGDITRTNWSSFQELKVVNSADGSPIALTTEDWKDVNRYSLGMNYKYNDRLKLRTGVALDKEPIPNANRRTPRIPGNDRKWVSVGANYKLNKGMSVDVGYSHLFVKNTDINNTDEGVAPAHTVKGTYKADVDIVGAQLNWRF